MSSTANKSKKIRKVSSTLRPFGMMKTKSESNLDQPFELFHVDIDVDKEEPEKPVEKESKFIELTPVPKRIIPPVLIQAIQERKGAGLETKKEKPSSLDDGLEEFFSGSRKKDDNKDTPPKVDLTTADLDAISLQTTA
jgi:hypothetical protein